jgi:hypothetical protein
VPDSFLKVASRTWRNRYARYLTIFLAVYLATLPLGEIGWYLRSLLYFPFSALVGVVLAYSGATSTCSSWVVLNTWSCEVLDYAYDLGSGLIVQSQKQKVAAMEMADMKVWAHRS